MLKIFPYQNCFRFSDPIVRYGVTFYACNARTRVKCNSVTKNQIWKTKTVLKRKDFLKILELSNSHLVNKQKKKKWSVVLKCVKVISQWQGLFLKIDHGFFRVIGPKCANKSRCDFEILIFSLLPFIIPPYLSAMYVYKPSYESIPL